MRTKLIINICSGLLVTPYWAIHRFTPHSACRGCIAQAFEKSRQIAAGCLQVFQPD